MEKTSTKKTQIPQDRLSSQGPSLDRKSLPPAQPAGHASVLGDHDVRSDSRRDLHPHTPPI